jgi:Zn-dependent peptidase ImmA (M78 family)
MKWLSSDKAMILLSLRGKSEDKFWFSFFHEAGHVVLQHSKKELFINDGPKSDPREQEADEYASEHLIPAQYDAAIRAACSKAELLGLSAKLGISPGIVVGRYQYLTKQWRNFNDLIRRFDWKPVQKGDAQHA